MADPACISAAAPGLMTRRDARLARVFGSTAYFRLWCAQVVSSAGDWIGLIAGTAIAARAVSGEGRRSDVGRAFRDLKEGLRYIGSNGVVRAVLHLPGVRVALWLGGAVILGAGVLTRRALRSASAVAGES